MERLRFSPTLNGEWSNPNGKKKKREKKKKRILHLSLFGKLVRKTLGLE
jgi:hypothetical protein